MKTARLVIGIASIVFFIPISLNSLIVGINILLTRTYDDGGFGIFFTLIMLAAGIIGIVVRKNKGGTITAACFYFLGGVICIHNVGLIWLALSFIFSLSLIFTVIFEKKKLIEKI